MSHLEVEMSLSTLISNLTQGVCGIQTRGNSDFDKQGVTLEAGITKRLTGFKILVC